jgi:hypothetical protein
MERSRGRVYRQAGYWLKCRRQTRRICAKQRQLHLACMADFASGWESLNSGTMTGSPAVSVNADGRLEVLSVGPYQALWDISQTVPGGNWSARNSLGGVIFDDPAVVANADGRLEAFVRGGTGALYHAWQSQPGANWSDWSILAERFQGHPAAIKNAAGELVAFVWGIDNAIWFHEQTVPGSTWSGRSSLEFVATTNPAGAINADGRLQVFRSPRQRTRTAPSSPGRSMDLLGRTSRRCEGGPPCRHAASANDGRLPNQQRVNSSGEPQAWRFHTYQRSAHRILPQELYISGGFQ